MYRKLALKKITLSLLYHSKILELIKYLSDRAGIILAYHRIIPTNSESRLYVQPGMYVTTRTFENHLMYLKRNYDLVPLHEFKEMHSLSNKCAITFDDGWYDNYEFAFPILKKYKVPATIFVCTKFIESEGWHWPDRLSFYLYAADEKQKSHIFNLIQKYVHDSDLDSILQSKSNDSTKLADPLIHQIKKMEHMRISSLFEEIDNFMSGNYSYFNKNRAWLNWTEINEMYQHNITFGAHTHTHTILTQTSIENARTEILKSRDILSDKLKTQIDHFSYPNGNYNPQILKILEETDFTLAVTTKRNRVQESDNRLLLPRISIHEDISETIPMFAARILGTIPFI